MKSIVKVAIAKEQMLKLQLELEEVLSLSQQTPSKKEKLEHQLLKFTEEKKQRKQALEVACKVQKELESRVQSDEEQVWLLSERVKTNEEENSTLKHKSSKLKAENRKLREALSESEDLRKSRQYLLVNISDFSAHVYQRWNLPRSFATKIQTWIIVNADKVDKAHDHWELETKVFKQRRRWRNRGVKSRGH